MTQGTSRPPAARRPRLLAWFTTVLSAVLLLAACDGGEPAAPRVSSQPLPTSVNGADPDPALARYYDQELTWTPCRDGAECTSLQVPIDYAQPDGEELTVQVLRLAASDPEARIGSLLVNPGGPGVSGMDYAARAKLFFGTSVRAAYDVVGFDPRGVGASRGLDCIDDARLDAFIAEDPTPDNAAEAATADRLARELGRGCAAGDPALVGHVSTQEAARDMDILRAALGQQSLVFFGASYGTYLGATYAEQFPDRVGRMVLDGALDPSVTTVELSRTQAGGFERALRAYVSGCVEDDDPCYLGDTVEAGLQRIRDFLAELDRQPLPASGPRQLTEGNAVYGIWLPLYNQGSWPVLDTALQQAFAGNGQTLLTLADQYVGRDTNGYTDQTIEQNIAINCLDHSDAPTPQQTAELVDSFVEVSPTFGRVFVTGLSSCSDWPVQTGNGPVTLSADGAAPILVVGTTRDPATPYEWAQALAEQLDSGVLVTRDGDGHTGYLAGNACVDKAVESYLIAGKVPSGDVTC